MRINQLPIVRTPDTALNTDEISGTIYHFSIVILQLEDGTYTWRGEGQNLPSRAKVIAMAQLVFAGDSDEEGEWPLEISPIAIDLNVSTHYFGTQAEWEQLNFDPHAIAWTANGHGRLTAAQFVRNRA